MSKTKIRHQNEKALGQQLLFDVADIQNDAIDLEGMENVLQQDGNVFLLNNLMMSVQFFENYDRDVRLLRENWFKEFSLESHHKKCFFADSLFRLSEVNVKFSPRHGPHKNSKTPLHPYRIYISSDNIEAASDPSALTRSKPNVSPRYQFTVNTNEKTDKSGCISLVEFQTQQRPNSRSRENIAFPIDSNETTGRNSDALLNKYSLEEKAARRLTKTEISIGFLNKNLNLKIYDKRCSVRCSPAADGTIPVNEFYKFVNPEARLKPQTIHEFRMNSEPSKAHEIPQACFQYEEVKNNVTSRRAELNSCFRTQRVLNSAAYKGHFCDLLIEKLAGPLNLDPRAVDESSVLQEFLIVNQEGVENRIIPVIPIRDRAKFVAVKRFPNAENPEGPTWPCGYMQRILNVLPCNAVPTSHAPAKDYLDYEKMWKLVFPKSEEFLLLHMMHAHIRCYFFALLVYKSFIESEINGASLGPNHLLHLLFWKVNKNFLAWPEDRPAETFLNYLKTLYKKLQNKHLSDFFITSRNLFADSLPRDLHKAQALIKKIMENPVPYIIRAISQLNLQENFYPTFDCEKLHSVLTAPNALEKLKITQRRKKKQKKVRFQDDEEQRWKKNIIKQIQLERKAEEEEQASRLSADSINVNEILNFDPEDYERCHQTLQMFTTHFIRMGIKSMDYDCLPQCLMYLHQTQRILYVMSARGMRQDLQEVREKIKQVQQFCLAKIKHQLRKSPNKQTKQFPSPSDKTEINIHLNEGKEAAFKQDDEGATDENNSQESLLLIYRFTSSTPDAKYHRHVTDSLEPLKVHLCFPE